MKILNAERGGDPIAWFAVSGNLHLIVALRNTSKVIVVPCDTGQSGPSTAANGSVSDSVIVAVSQPTQGHRIDGRASDFEVVRSYTRCADAKHNIIDKEASVW